MRRARGNSDEPSLSEQEILDDRPQLDPIEQRQIIMLVDAWHALGGDRKIGFGVMGCIPFTAIVTWGEFYGLDREAILIVAEVFRILDRDRVERDEAKRRLERGAES